MSLRLAARGRTLFRQPSLQQRRWRCVRAGPFGRECRCIDGIPPPFGALLRALSTPTQHPNRCSECYALKLSRVCPVFPSVWEPRCGLSRSKESCGSGEARRLDLGGSPGSVLFAHAYLLRRNRLCWLIPRPRRVHCVLCYTSAQAVAEDVADTLAKIARALKSRTGWASPDQSLSISSLEALVLHSVSQS